MGFICLIGGVDPSFIKGHLSRAGNVKVRVNDLGYHRRPGNPMDNHTGREEKKHHLKNKVVQLGRINEVKMT